MLKFVIKSCFLWSSHQIHFKYTAWFHCIILINMWVFTSWYIVLFSAFFGVLSLFLLRNCGLGKCFWLNPVYFQVLNRITSNLVHGLIVSYSSICWWLQADIFYTFLNFCCFYHCIYLEKYGLGKVIRFVIKSRLPWSSHQNIFKFDAWIHCIITIYMWVITCLYILLFSAFLCFFSIFTLAMEYNFIPS